MCVCLPVHVHMHERVHVRVHVCICISACVCYLGRCRFRQQTIPRGICMCMYIGEGAWTSGVRLGVCIRVYVFPCVRVRWQGASACMCVRLAACAYVCMLFRACACVCVHACMCIRICAYVLRASTCTYAFPCACTCVRVLRTCGIVHMCARASGKRLCSLFRYMRAYGRARGPGGRHDGELAWWRETGVCEGCFGGGKRVLMEACADGDQHTCACA